MKTYRLGTRASNLAYTQSSQVAALLQAQGLNIELVQIRTQGDTDPRSLASLGGSGVFAAALRQALLAGQCDLAVHSFKDLPTAPTPGLVVAAVPKRASYQDVLCARDGLTLSQLPTQSRVGTGSPRRAAQLRQLRPDLRTVDIRGNVGTRLNRVIGRSDHGDLDAVVLAQAGLERLGLTTAITDKLSLESPSPPEQSQSPLPQFLPAPAQGALAIECRQADISSKSDLTYALASINHLPTHLCALAERAVLSHLQAGCAAPIGALAQFQQQTQTLVLQANVTAVDGSKTLNSYESTQIQLGTNITTGTATDTIEPDSSGSGGDLYSQAYCLAQQLGRRVGADLLHHGADQIADLQASKPDCTHDESSLWHTAETDRPHLLSDNQIPTNTKPAAHKPAASNKHKITDSFVLVPRPHDDHLVTDLRREGLRVWAEPLTSTWSLPGPHWDQVGLRLTQGYYSWVTVTSPKTFQILSQSSSNLGQQLRQAVADGTKLAVVGPACAKAAKQFGLRVDLLPALASGKGLVQDWPNTTPNTEPGPVLLLRSALAAQTLPSGLLSRGWPSEILNVYTTYPLPDVSQSLRQLWAAGQIRAAIITAGSTANALAKLLLPIAITPRSETKALSESNTDNTMAALIALGHSSAQSLTDLGLPIGAIANSPASKDIVAAIRSIPQAQEQLFE